MDFAFTETQQMLQDATRRYAQERLSKGSRAREEAHAIPHEVVRELAEQGLLGVNIPEELGGAEAGPVAYVVALREIAAVDAAVAVTMAVTNMVGEVISRFGTQAQKERYVPSLCNGAFFAGAFALSEPQAGSDAGSLATRALKQGDRYILNGEKMWISAGDQADVIVVWARTGDAGAKGISCFLVERGTPGLSAGKPEEKMGLRASHTVSLSLQDVEVPADALLGQVGEGFKIAMTALDGGRLGIGAQSLGIARAAVELATAYVKERRQFGRALADFQAVQHKLADMATEMDAGWLLTLRAATMKARGERFSPQAAMAKVYASEAANRIVREAVQLLGGYGYMEEYEVARLYRDCRVTQIYEGTSEVQRMVIARSLLREGS
jgi:alkylation response protein AidB-like acyl-CoA dehydrogenase